MRKRTINKIQFTFAFLIFIGITISFFYMMNKPVPVPKDNIMVKNVMFYQGIDNKNAIIVISWQQKVNKTMAINKENYFIEHVKPEGRKWVIVPNGKNFRIDNIQYVYAPWVDTAEKRKKADPDKREERVIQLSINIEPKEQPDDYFKVTIRNIETDSGEKLSKEEYAVVQVNKFVKFLKM